MTEKQIEKTKKKIKEFRAFLSAEKRKFGGYFDNRGLRYEIAMLYGKIKDFKGAKRYFNWFEKEFDDDIGFPEFHLVWSVTMFENNDLEKALKKLYAIAFANRFIIDHLIDEKKEDEIDPKSLGFESVEDVKNTVEFCTSLVTDEFVKWVDKIVESEEYKKNLRQYTSLQKLIKDEPVGETRSMLIDEETKFLDSLIN